MGERMVHLRMGNSELNVVGELRSTSLGTIRKPRSSIVTHDMGVTVKQNVGR